MPYLKVLHYSGPHQPLVVKGTHSLPKVDGVGARGFHVLATRPYRHPALCINEGNRTLQAPCLNMLRTVHFAHTLDHSHLHHLVVRLPLPLLDAFSGGRSQLLVQLLQPWPWIANGCGSNIAIWS